MAIQFLTTPTGETHAGIFTLPANFDRQEHAAKWVKVGHSVAAAANREHLVGTSLTADGWEVWKDGKTPATGVPHKIPAASGEYILLFRSRKVQDAVNAIYGNVGKERMQQEKRGQTTGGVPITDNGMLGEERLSRATGESNEDEPVAFNPVPDIEKTLVVTK